MRNVFHAMRALIFVVVLFSTATVQAFDLSWNGFGSVYYGQATDSGLLPFTFSNTHVDFTNFSLVGLNLGATVSDELKFAAQFVALGSPIGSTDSFGLLAQWAYVNYTPYEGTSIKMGRQLYPFLLASEYVRVNYLMPFRQIPGSFFNVGPFTRFDGISVSQSSDTEVGKMTVGAFGGSPLLDVNTTLLVGTSISVKDLLGMQAILEGNGWRVRAQASRYYTQTSVPVLSIADSGHSQTYSAGYRYDRYNIVSWGEYVMTRTPDGTPAGGGRYSGDGRGFYWLGGYRFGKFMPRYTFVHATQDYNIFSPVTRNYVNGSVSTHTIGVNYQASQQAVIKVEYERDVVAAPQGGGYFVTQPSDATVTSGGAFYAGLDFIF